MKFTEIMMADTALGKLYSTANGVAKLKARRIVKPFQEELKAFQEELQRLMKEAGAEEVVENGAVSYKLEGLEDGDTKGAAERQILVKAIQELQLSEVEIKVSEPFTLEEVVDIDISNPDIDRLITVGVIIEE